MPHNGPVSDPARDALPAAPPPVSFFEAVGGEAAFARLVRAFYAGVADDPVLRPLYPPDLSEAEDRLRWFLVQYWGGPATYGEQRGHPRLRMRHTSFAIGPAERDAWLRHMDDAVATLGLPEHLATPLREYLHAAAYGLTNRPAASP